MPSFKRINKMIKLLDCTPNELLLGEFAAGQSEGKVSCRDHVIYENRDNTIIAVVKMMQRMNPEKKLKVFQYAKGQECLSEYF